MVIVVVVHTSKSGELTVTQLTTTDYSVGAVAAGAATLPLAERAPQPVRRRPNPWDQHVCFLFLFFSFSLSLFFSFSLSRSLPLNQLISSLSIVTIPTSMLHTSSYASKCSDQCFQPGSILLAVPFAHQLLRHDQLLNRQ